MFFETNYATSGFVPTITVRICRQYMAILIGEMMITNQILRRTPFSDKPARVGSMDMFQPISWFPTVLSLGGSINLSSLFLSCFHPQRHSRSSSSPGTVLVSCRDGQSFHQSRGYLSQKNGGYKTKYHRDMG